MGSCAGRDAVPKVEAGPVEEFVFTDVEVEHLPGGMLRLLFFCEQRPLGAHAEPECVLKARAVTTPELWPQLARKIEFAFCERPPRKR